MVVIFGPFTKHQGSMWEFWRSYEGKVWRKTKKERDEDEHIVPHIDWEVHFSS